MGSRPVVIGLYALLSTILTPVWLAVCAAHPRLRSHLGERLGAPRLEVEPGAVWIHAASLGEGRAAEAVVTALRTSGAGVPILRTCTSDNARSQRIGADQTLCLPIDVPWVIGRWLDAVRPRCLVLVEAELWPALLAGCRRRGIPVVVVGARVGRKLARLRRIPGLWGGLTRGVRWLPADAHAAAIVGGRPIGELKREAPVPTPAVGWSRQAVVGGSTRAGEEQALLAAIRAMSPRPLLVLAPREPARWPDVARWLDGEGERWIARTRLSRDVPDDVDVLLLDTLGELAGLYAGARVAFVGGTFDPAVGGHSPAEAQAAGCPVVHGPHTHAHPAAFAAPGCFPTTAAKDLAAAIARAWDAPRLATGGSALATIRAELAPLTTVPYERALRPWLWPLVPLWRLGVALRRRPERRMPIPVIAVGGLTAGGSGKTPVSAWIADRLRALDPAVIARGYGREAGSPVRTDGTAEALGDELAMLAGRGLRVVSSPDRAAGVEAAVKLGARVAILDDALQNGDVAHDLEIVVIDARWPMGGGPIPVGTARVPASWLARADVVWVNHGVLPPSLARHVRTDAVLVQARYRAVGWTHRGDRLPPDALSGRSAVAFAGIAHPQGFFQLVRDVGVRIERAVAFPDHHRYRPADLADLRAALAEHILVTTEKDAARLPPDLPVHVLHVAPELVAGGADLEARLAAFAERHASEATG